MCLNKRSMKDFLHIGRASEISDTGDRRFYRALEILPGFLAWITLITIIILSFLAPVFIAVFIIIFDIYWLIKTVYLSLHLRVSYSKLRENLKINWLEKLTKLPIANYKLQSVKSWQDIYHLIFLPLYKEDFILVSSTVESLARSNFHWSRSSSTR